MPLPGVDHEETCRPGGGEHSSQRSDDGTQQADVVAERLAEPTGLDEVALHVDHDQRDPLGVEAERSGLGSDGERLRIDGHRAAPNVVASITASAVATHPNTPPCMVTMCSAARWLPGSVAPVQSERTRHS